MKKLLGIVVLSLLLSVNAYAKTKVWDYKKESNQIELIKCIKIIDIKTKTSFINTLGNMGLFSEVPGVLRIQNNCKEGIKGWVSVEMLDKDDFLLEDTLAEFNVGRKGIKKINFDYYMSPLKLRKAGSMLLRFDQLEKF